MTLPQILGIISIGVITLFIVIYFAIIVEKYTKRKWIQASAQEVIMASAIIIALFTALLLAAIIRIGLLIGGIL